MITRYLVFIFSLLFSNFIWGQDSITKDGYQKFYYPNGKLSSEGTMREGKPDGYWKTFNEDGTLISEGNRKNFQLDSTWIFYNSKGDINQIINYKFGLKSGTRITYFPDKIVVDSFENDLKNNWNYIYYPNEVLQNKTFYKNGIEEGWSIHYSKSGLIVGRTFYVNGFIRKRENFNYTDYQGNKEGEWKEFYENEEIKQVGYYRKGIKDGYFKYYDKDGNLEKIEKYRNGILYEDAEEIATYEIRTDYYEDGKIKVIGSYKDSLAEGVRREYSREGKITDSYIMHKGFIVGHGLLDESGKKQGFWEFFYDNGRLSRKGNYKDNIQQGEWNYYYESGKLMQNGNFDVNGLYTGIWTWYYENGKVRVKENYLEGDHQGSYSEFDENGNICVDGNYYRGSKEGEWIEQGNGYIEQGSYLDNVEDGLWKYYYNADSLYFEGNFIDGNPDGIHKWYYRNGNILQEGRYIMGIKEGDWKYYNEEGQLSLRIKYENGIETEYNSVRIEPELKQSELE